ncbi:flagellar basal body stator protein MotB [Geomonas sp. Red276]
MRKKEPEKEPNHERWLVSYGDLLTLLFAVFVTLYAMSQQDKKKAEDAAQSIREAFGMVQVGSGASQKPAIIDGGKPVIVPDLHRPSLPPPAVSGRKPLAGESDLRAIKAALDAYLMKKGAGGKVSTSLSERGLVISLKEAGFFDSGSAGLKGDNSEIVGEVAAIVNRYANRCSIEGHTDDQPINNRQYNSNWDLSTARATSLVKKLVGEYGVSPQQVSATGFGEYQPVAENATAEGRAKNRRVDVVVLGR